MGKIKKLGQIKMVCSGQPMQVSCVVDAFWAKNTNLDVRSGKLLVMVCCVRGLKKAGSGLDGLKAGCDRLGSSPRARIGPIPSQLYLGGGHGDHYRRRAAPPGQCLCKKGRCRSLPALSQEVRFAAYTHAGYTAAQTLEAFQFAKFLPECRYALIPPAVHVESHLLSAFYSAYPPS